MNLLFLKENIKQSEANKKITNENSNKSLIFDQFDEEYEEFCRFKMKSIQRDNSLKKSHQK